MERVGELLTQLRERDVKLWLDGERLRYSAPPGGLSDELREDLRAHKSDITAFLREAQQAARSAPPMQRIPRDGAMPLSFAQERLWFLNQFQSDGGGATYNMCGAVRLDGPLDIEALERSFDTICDRHETLRSRFPVVDGTARLVIEPQGAIPLPVIDLSHLERPANEAEVRRHAAEDYARAFDMAAGPLLRLALFRFHGESHVLVLNMHHVISDGWSLGILIRELGTLYSAYAAKRRSPLPELALQYVDYASWQREWLQGKTLEFQLDYWRDQLAGLPPLLALPTDHPRPAMQTYRGAQVPVRLGRELTAKLHRLSHDQGATLFMTLLAGFSVLLSRYSGMDDVSIGTPVANRGHRDTEALIGFFVNTLVMRARLERDPSFVELLRQVRAMALDAYAHQDVPFEQLVAALQPERSLSHTPLFQVMLMLQNAPMEPLSLPGLSISPFAIESPTAKFDLTLSLEESQGRLEGWIEYTCDLFERSTIQRMVEHLERLLQSAVAAPERPVSELALLGAAEREQLLGRWNDTAVPAPAAASIHEQLEAQAARSPQRTALVFEDRSLSYEALNAQANQLAHYLNDRGVGPETLVGVYATRGIEMVVAILGILKSGAAYLPLDPKAPAPRTCFIVKDSSMALLLTASEHACDLDLNAQKLIVHDIEHDAIAAYPTTNPAVVSQAEHQAYVIYTSGSTGEPKGVVLEHRNVLNFFTGMDRVAGDDEPGTWLAVTTIAFDISVLELLWTLTRGYKVVIQGEQESYFPEAAVEPSRRAIDFSLMYFANAGDQHNPDDKYRLLLEGAKFADRNGFRAVWTPERHFHAFGDLYPNPSVSGAALATVTEHIRIRAGSVVMPLHHPLRVAEEWSMVDNLSHGRVGVSFASGWQADDFVLAPNDYAERKSVMLEGIDRVRRLWRGESLTLPNGHGKPVEVGILPRPIQSELPVWVTAAGSPDTFRQAGKIGANLLTHLLGQDIEQLADKIALYRHARAEHGHDPESGVVSLMLHAFIGSDIDTVRETVREPFCEYLKSSFDLLSNLARSMGLDIRSEHFTPADMDALLSHAFERYFSTSGLFGTPEHCLGMVERLRQIGVDEIACLIDFGVDSEVVLEGLKQLDELRRRATAPRASAPEPAASRWGIAAQIDRHGVTHLQCTPSLARLLLSDAETRRTLGSLRKLCVGGEELPAALAELICEASTGEVWNLYGPTETSIWSSAHRVCARGDAKPSAIPDAIPIGTPIANTAIHLLDAHQRPVPVGVQGEIFIGGAGVARGYWDRPELNRQRFVPDPFHPEGSQRLYRTGDRGRRLPGGEIVFMGRMDHQVKIHGFRVELGEIESLLGRLPGVRDCVVVTHEDPAGDQRLVAYVAASESDAPAVRSMRTALDEQLPDYMVPSAFVRLDKLPLTANGKVNRLALPAPTGHERASDRELIAPRDPVELQLVPIWEQVLGVHPVGVTDNFFEHGGHSLLAVRLLAEIEDKLGKKLPLASLFRGPTIEQMAKLLDELTGGASALTTVVEIQRGASLDPLFLIPGAGGNVIYFHDLVRRLGPHSTVYGFQTVVIDEHADSATLVEDLAAHYIEEMRILQPQGPYRLAGHSFGGHVAFEMARQLLAAGEAIALLGILDSPAPVHREHPLGKDWDLAEWVAFITKIVRRLYLLDLGLTVEDLRPLDMHAQVDLLIERMKAYSLLPPEANRTRMQGFVELFKADHQSTYEPRGRYPGRITLFRAEELHPDNIPHEQMIPLLEDPALGWTPFSDQPIEVFDVPGDHLTMITEPHVRGLADPLRECLQRSMDKPASTTVQHKEKQEWSTL